MNARLARRGSGSPGSEAVHERDRIASSVARGTKESRRPDPLRVSFTMVFHLWGDRLQGSASSGDSIRSVAPGPRAHEQGSESRGSRCARGGSSRPSVLCMTAHPWTVSGLILVICTWFHETDDPDALDGISAGDLVERMIDHHPRIHGRELEPVRHPTNRTSARWRSSPGEETGD